MIKDFIAQRVARRPARTAWHSRVFLVDQLARGEPATPVLNCVRGVVSEYAGAEGYTAEWDQILEQTFGHLVAARDVANSQIGEIAAAQLTVDHKIERGQMLNPAPGLEVDSECADALRLEGRLLSYQFAYVSGLPRASGFHVGLFRG
jgi:hypothetical protein